MSVSVGYVQSHGLEAQTDEQRPQLLVWNDSSNSQCKEIIRCIEVSIVTLLIVWFLSVTKCFVCCTAVLPSNC